MKKSTKIIIFIMVIGFIVTLGVAYSLNDVIRNRENNNFKVTYDTSWKLRKSETEFHLEHRKSNAILEIQSKVLDDNYLNTDLKDIISDIIYDIEKQNDDYKLINMLDSPSNRYQSYSYLYEKNDLQVLVNVYKKDNVLVVAYYEAESKYYDIVLDSVDTILNSLEIKSGIKVN